MLLDSHWIVEILLQTVTEYPQNPKCHSYRYSVHDFYGTFGEIIEWNKTEINQVAKYNMQVRSIRESTGFLRGM